MCESGKAMKNQKMYSGILSIGRMFLVSDFQLPVAGKATAGAGRGKQPSAATFFGAAASKKSTKATEKPVKKVMQVP